MKIYTQDNQIKQIARSAFGDDTGAKLSVDTFGPTRLDSNWEGGSRDYYAFVSLETMRSVPVPENGTPFSNGGKILRCESLPLNIVMVRHSIYRGKDLGCTVYFNPEQLTKFLPAVETFTLAEQIVLVTTRERKSSYNGRNRQQMAADECGLPASEWEQAKVQLISKGYLKLNGAITDEGRNHAGTTIMWNLKWPALAA